VRRLQSSESKAVGAAALALIAVATLLSACVEEPPPRSFTEFMDDSLAREGTLVRCNADRDATANDIECINARRAAQAIAAQEEEQKRARLEEQSEARLIAARQRADAQFEAQRQAEVAAEQEAERAYEAQWSDTTTDTIATVGIPDTSSAGAVSGSTVVGAAAAPQPQLEPVNVPTVRPPLTTVSLPRGAKPIEYQPPQPKLEEIVVPNQLKPAN